MALCGDATEADDLVQETLKRVLTYSRNGKEIRNLRAYLFRALHNVRADAAVQGARFRLSVSLDDTPLEIPCAAVQDSRVEFNEVAEALKKLPEQQREVVLLVGLEGLSYRGAAEVLGVPIGTVMSRLNRARQALRHLMADVEQTDPPHRKISAVG